MEGERGEELREKIWKDGVEKEGIDYNERYRRSEARFVKRGGSGSSSEFCCGCGASRKIDILISF